MINFIGFDNFCLFDCFYDFFEEDGFLNAVVEDISLEQ